MRKVLMGLLLAATAAAPAFADKGGHGHGGRHDERGHGGWKHGDDGERGRGRWRGEDRHGWDREARVAPPVRVVRFDEDKWERKAWKRREKEERRWAREWERHERFRPAQRMVRVEPLIAPRPVIRYAEPVRVRYPQAIVIPAYERPLTTYPASAPATYWPGNVSPLAPAYPAALGLLGNGGGLLGALLPVVLQSGIGNSLDLGSLGGLGGLGGLGSLTGLGGLGALTGSAAPDVYPLDLASYAPYSSNNGDLVSPLLPVLLGNGSLL